MIFQRFPLISIDFQRFSTFFNVFQRFSTFFNDFQRFLGARPYRGVSGKNLRILVAQRSKKVRFEAKKVWVSVPIIFPVYNLNIDKKVLTRTRGENVNNKVWVSVPIIFDKKSPRPRDNKGTFKKTKKTKCPGVSANSGRRKSGTRAEIPQPITIDFPRGPVCLRFASGLPGIMRRRGNPFGPCFHAHVPRITVVCRTQTPSNYLF